MNNDTKKNQPNQVLANLPRDIISTPRFFAVNAKKAPLTKGWSNPENQKHAGEIGGLCGFDTAGHGVAPDYLFLDFDHIFDDKGNFITDRAEYWFNFVAKLDTYCELSASKHGAHFLAVPTAGKFGKVASGKNGRIYFDPEKKSFVEIFYGTGGRYCFFTGDVYRCDPQTPVAQGEHVDEVFQALLDEVARQNPTKKKKEPPKMQEKNSPINPDDSPLEPTHADQNEQDRAVAMLKVIPAAALTYQDWIQVGMILKNNGNTLSDWEEWSRADARFKDGECAEKWSGFNGGGLTIATLHMLAQFYGYSEADYLREHGGTCRIIHRPPDADELKRRLEELKKQPRTPARDRQIVATIRDLCTWNQDKLGNPTTIKSTIRNIEKIFRHDPNLDGLIALDEFQGEIIFRKNPPWSSGNQIGEKWRDADDAHLRSYLRKNYAELKERQLIEDYVIVYAYEKAFHPIKKFLENLPSWDGTPRAETIFSKFLGAKDNEYTREVTLKWLLGFVARVYHPGCDFQWCPVINGAQRIGKSRLARMLGGKEGVNPGEYQWHVALKDSVDDSHAVDALQKGGIIEIEEFSAARKAEINALKSFISAEEDTRRFAYDKRASTRKRHSVFIVTCNDQQFLRDPTGNTRFWIIECAKEKFKRVDGMTPEYIRQVWAEVYYRYQELFKDGFDEAKLRPSEALERRAEEIADAYVQDDGLTLEIKSHVDKKIPPPAVWKLMTKDERRKFFVDGYITFDVAILNYRRRSQGGREQDVDRDIDEIYRLTNSKRTYVQEVFIAESNKPLYRFFGAEYRQHICAAEIYNEAFANGDKRKLMYRINEILTDLEGWHLGDRLQKADPEYSNQKKPYWRDEDNQPDDDGTAPTSGDEPNTNTNRAACELVEYNSTSEDDDDLPI